MENELDVLFNKSADFDLSEKRGEEKKMTNFAAIQKGMTALGVVSMLYSGISMVAPDKLGVNPLKEMEPTEAAYLSQVERYCFNRIPMLNDTETCQLWAGKYVQLISGFEKPLDPFGAKVQKELTAELHEKVEPSKLPQSKGSAAQ